jgi:hypothetical protein
MGFGPFLRPTKPLCQVFSYTPRSVHLTRLTAATLFSYPQWLRKILYMLKRVQQAK